MPRRTTFLAAALPFLLATVARSDWPQFRGPDGQGHSSVKRLPLRWSEDAANITWKVPIEGLGWSSPVVKGGRIWLTTATDDGRSLRAVCLDAKTGRTLRDVEVFRRDDAGKIHGKNSHASPTPILADGRVYVHFGSYGTACLDEKTSDVVWRQTLEYKPVHGPGGSPVLQGGLLVVNCDGGDRQFVAALDAASGDVRWKTERPANSYGKKFAFSTPLAIDVGGRAQIVSPGAGGVSSYDPASGREVWRVDYSEGYSVVPRPVFGHGLLFVSSGFDRPSLYAIRADGRGNVTDTHVAWTESKGAPHSPSALLVGDELYFLSDRGVATCVDARSGERHWQERLGGNFSASPLYAAGRIYALDERGTTTIFAPGKKYKELAVNKLPGRTLATPAPVEGALLLRTDTHLFRIEAE